MQVALVDHAVAVHDPDGEDPGVGRDLAHDPGDEGAVTGRVVQLADQRIAG